MSKKKVVVHDVPPPDDEDFEAWRYDDDLGLWDWVRAIILSFVGCACA